MGVQLLFNPLDTVLDQGDKIKVGVEKFNQILLGIVTIVREDLRLADTQHL